MKTTMTSRLNLLIINNTITYDIGNPGPVLGQAQTYGGIKRYNCHF